VSCFDPATHDHFLFECTEHAARAFEDYRVAAGSIRGCYFSASRPKKARNAKVIIICKPYDPSKCNLPEPPDVTKALCVIWRVPYNGLEVCGNTNGKKKAIPVEKVLARMHNQPDNACDPTPISDILSGNGK
jgi:hypothetical protein